eukprot:145952_1
MTCFIEYNDNHCKLFLPFNGTDLLFRTLVTKRLGLKQTDKYHIICEHDNDHRLITTHQQLKPNTTYQIIYIDKEAKKTQNTLRQKKLNDMRRNNSTTNLPFSKQKK